MDKGMQDKLIETYVVAGVVIEQNNQYLLVQENSPKAYGLWNFPAGRVEVGQTLERTAVREAKEETGYDVELLGKIGVYQYLAEQPPKHAFMARIVGGELNFPQDEIMDARWFNLAEIEAMKDELRDRWILDALNDLIQKREK